MFDSTFDLFINTASLHNPGTLTTFNGLLEISRTVNHSRER